jgi:hypothetical protein
MITDEQIHDTIDKCPFAQKFYDVAVCRLLVEPCVSGVNEGRCPELQKLFSDSLSSNLRRCATRLEKNEEDLL